jgi:hypothetical protein
MNTKHTLLRSAALAAFATLAASNLALAQTGPDLLLTSFEDGKFTKGSANYIYVFDGETDNDDADAQLSIYSANGMAKLDLDSLARGLDLNRAQPRGGFEYTMIHVDSDDNAIPEQMTDASIGIGLGIGKGERWVAGLSVALGHASTNTFGDGNGWYGKADIAVGYTIDEKQSIGFILDYDGNRTFYPDIPLPGFVYKRTLNDQTKISVGFPYTDLEYKPDDRWTVALRYVIPDSGEATVEFKAAEALRIYASYSSMSEAFHWNELSNDNDRVLFFQSRVELGLRGTYNDSFSFIVAGGYAFGQQFEVGYDSTDTDLLAELSDEPFARVAFQLDF